MKKLKLGHIIYRVNNLKKAVKEWEDKGFTVEYGKSKNPYNALIYFQEGAYIELLQSEKCVPKFFKIIFKLFGSTQFLGRVEKWENTKEGLADLCLEVNNKDFAKLIDYLNSKNLNVKKMSWNRKDTKNRKIPFTCFFPNDIEMPFFSGELDTRLRSVIHKNNIKKVKSITLKTDTKKINLLKDIIDINELKLAKGNCLTNIEFEY